VMLRHHLHTRQAAADHALPAHLQPHQHACGKEDVSLLHPQAGIFYPDEPGNVRGWWRSGGRRRL
jgi:hypothetical protein